MSEPGYTPRLVQRYIEVAVPALREKFNFKNNMQVPRLKKIVLNMGLGQAVGNPKIVDAAVGDLRTLAGQQPVVCRARKSIAGFKLREGMPIGTRVTLRRDRMWEFTDRLIAIVLPRIRDFRGVKDKLDGRGNYTLGLSEQSVFPEISYDQIEFQQGMDITFVTSALNDEQGHALLSEIGMPFQSKGNES